LSPARGVLSVMDLDVGGIEQAAGTGPVPDGPRLDRTLAAAYRHAERHREGRVADYIPILAGADPDAFGLCLADVGGGLHELGATRTAFSIQSISKVFVYALLCEAYGHERVLDVVGVNNTGLPFNSVVAIELNDGHPMNPMVNAGAIATTALLPGETPQQQWAAVRDGLSRFAGHPLDVDEEVYRSEAATNHRNRAIAQLLASYGRIERDPLAVVDVYTRQCALRVDARDLAVMGATLADGGVNPRTGERVVAADVCRDALAVLATSGLYERSGEWLFEIGLPGKSGVAGGLVTVAPGKLGIGAYAPRLDAAGNSVRGQIATAYLSRALGLNVFASAPAQAVRDSRPASTPPS
jgi:glutaminase